MKTELKVGDIRQNRTGDKFVVVQMDVNRKPVWSLIETVHYPVGYQA